MYIFIPQALSQQQQLSNQDSTTSSSCCRELMTWTTTSPRRHWSGTPRSYSPSSASGTTTFAAPRPTPSSHTTSTCIGSPLTSNRLLKLQKNDKRKLIKFYNIKEQKKSFCFWLDFMCSFSVLFQIDIMFKCYRFKVSFFPGRHGIQRQIRHPRRFQSRLLDRTDCVGRARYVICSISLYYLY